VNFYPFHIGDYASATAHLSELEDLYYRRLLDCYYTREQAIPLEPRAAWRLVRAQTEEARAAVSDVLGEFFRREEDGWHHGRCDAEIVKANEKKSKAAQSAAKRWSSANAQRPSNASAMPTQSERSANASTKPCERIETPCEGNAPNPNPNPNPNPKEKKKRADAPVLEVSDLQAEGVPPDVAAAWFVVRKSKHAGPLTSVAWDGFKREAAKAGWPLDAAVRESAERGWQGFRADWVTARKAVPRSSAPAAARPSANSV
jgi:uncharacterized protein YdaU (DUF1376 family)